MNNENQSACIELHLLIYNTKFNTKYDTMQFQCSKPNSYIL